MSEMSEKEGIIHVWPRLPEKEKTSLIPLCVVLQRKNPRFREWLTEWEKKPVWNVRVFPYGFFPTSVVRHPRGGLVPCYHTPFRLRKYFPETTVRE